MKTALKKFVTTLGVLALMGTSAIAATMDYLGAWSGTTTYATGKVVVYNRAIYYSLRSTTAAPNRNRLPTDATWWAQVGTLGNTLHSGLQAPMNAIGNVGDYYIDTANNRLFGPKNAVTGWPAGAVNLVGQTGPAGAQGSQGATGLQGATGPQGIPGLKGDTGIQGSAGVAGADGKTILSGTTIPDQSSGAVGDFYLNTTTSVLYGPKTINGWPGSGTSLVGSRGEQGIQGLSGAQGIQGAQGPVGPQGPAGTDGARGVQGVPGAQGAQGAQGQQGIQGAKGDIGIQGSAGVAGADGKTILSGTTIPDQSSGAVGDFYLNTTTSVLYGPKTINGWPGSGTSLVGSRGEQGIQGLSGAQGIQGAQGPVGPQGPAGTDGAVGPAGSQGTQGPQGIAGATGAQGIAGATGAQGIAGISGLASKSCITGYVIGFDSNSGIICSGSQSTYVRLSATGKTAAQARSYAISMTSGRNHCYLANITTQSEMDYIYANVSGVANTDRMLLGGRRDSNFTTTWYWADGPEAGNVFWQDGAAVGSNFPGWDPQNRTETWNKALYTVTGSYFHSFISGAYDDAYYYLVECTDY